MKQKLFETWLIDNNRPERYAKTIITISKDLEKIKYTNHDLFSINNAQTIQKIKTDYFKIDEYYKKNRRGQNMYNSALNRYIEFLKEHNENILIETSKQKNNMLTIKDKAYLALQQLGGRATEAQLVEKYIKMYPDYDKNYTKTEKTSKEKIRGTLSAVLISNTQHEKIKVDKTKKPYEYYTTDSKEQLIVIQPIGTHNSIDDFLEYNNSRWAEKERYKQQWLQSNGAIVLFVKNANVFAMGNITNIEETDDKEYPLDYSYNLELVDYIDYQTILEIVKPQLGNFRTYQLLDNITSKQVIDHINSQKIYYLDDNSADAELQENITNITSNEPEHKPQPIKSSKEKNGGKIYPRNLAYAKKALEEASFSCEVDNIHKTFFSRATNEQYMEAHHLIPLQFQEEFLYSLDIPVNIVSVCPTCHRKLHFGFIEDKKEILKKLLERKNARLKEFGIEITEDELFEIYT
ncbi:hypothetical protein CVO_06025 [Sulfurimonas sp. CVO]|uniref:HNH endonuclease n=1 Tax=Sulfurimonas sp. CVO TaxID=2283483 RepID=UPI00132F455C|nr:hypothetical protein [Sulfurimonas sp. CVO]QHG91418.1 hypothetical protein CVO_06025 [Sulfurimonas sp. CVO]